jgi:hypothetical protein
MTSKGKNMINKILIMLASSLMIAGISFGIYSARELVTRDPICYWEIQSGFSGINFAETYMLLILGLGIGVALMTVLNSLIEEGE